jgi:hypothetical protein
MEVVPYSINKELVQTHRRFFDPELARYRGQFVANLFHLVCRKQIRHLARAKNVVDVFQKVFNDNLGVHKKEYRWLVLYSC